MSKFPTAMLKTSNIALYKLKRTDTRSWKPRKKGVAALKARSNKNIDSRFKVCLRKVKLKMPKVEKEKHRRLTYSLNVIFKKERDNENNFEVLYTLRVGDERHPSLRKEQEVCNLHGKDYNLHYFWERTYKKYPSIFMVDF